mgnify:CR=1 FL=1
MSDNKIFHKSKKQITVELEKWGETCKVMIDGRWCETLDKECDGGGCNCPIITKE